MTVAELITQLTSLPPEYRDLRVGVHDGLDPSDIEEADRIEVQEHWSDPKPIVVIL